MPKSPHGPRNWRLHSDPVENEERAIARHTPLSLLLDDPKVEVLSAENTKAPDVIISRLLKASGRSVPWPLADSERVDGLASSGSPAAASSRRWA